MESTNRHGFVSDLVSDEKKVVTHLFFDQLQRLLFIECQLSTRNN